MKDVLKSLRLMAWERAKAELMCMSCTHWHETEVEYELEQRLFNKVSEFIKEVEDNGLHE
jgi:hypothetical protein